MDSVFKVGNVLKYKPPLLKEWRLKWYNDEEIECLSSIRYIITEVMIGCVKLEIIQSLKSYSDKMSNFQIGSTREEDREYLFDIDRKIEKPHNHPLTNIFK